LRHYGTYDVIVAGAGMSGVVAAAAAARHGARTLLVEGTGLIGGLITGGRLTKPTGIIQPGIYRELVKRAAGYGGADLARHELSWGSYAGVFDPETMQRVIIEVLDEAGVEYLLEAPVTDTIMDGARVRGVVVHTKAGPCSISAPVTVDTTGDGDVAALAGARAMVGDESGLTQPMTSYLRILNVSLPGLIKDCRSHPEDMVSLTVAEGADDGDGRNEDHLLTFHMEGFRARIQDARAQGFRWIVPRNRFSIRSGLLPGEVNVNATRVQGNALDPADRTRAAIEMRRQAYCLMDFLKAYVGGFENAVLFEVAPVLGVRETRRIHGDYVLTGTDVRGQARFSDAIGLCDAPVDIHEPGGEDVVMTSTGGGYGIPYRCLLPAGLDGLLTAGRCVSADPVAFGSLRNTPACALTGQAAGTAAALASSRGLEPRALTADPVQDLLRGAGIVLGTSRTDTVPAWD